jgi:hypothetical protein
MKNKILILFGIILSLFILNFTSSYYAGETIVFTNELGKTNLFYTIVDNSTQIEGLIVDVNETNISVTFPQNMKPDSFKIALLENNTQTITQTQTITVYSGGGGSTKTIYKNNTIIQEVPNYITQYENTSCSDCELNNSNTSSVEIVKKNRTWIYIILGIGIILFIVGLIYKIKSSNSSENLNDRDIRRL